MTVAEKMKVVAENAEKERQVKLKDKHTRYCYRLIETKIRRAANRGKKECKIKLRKSYVASWIVDMLISEKFGFSVVSSVANGRHILKICW
jgi:hypothetical protein